MTDPTPEPAVGPKPRHLSLAATFTADALRGPFEVWADVLHLDLELRLAPYAQLFQQLLDPASGLRQNRAGANVLLVRWDDLAGRCPAMDPVAQSAWIGKVQEVANEIAAAVSSAAFHVPTLVLLAASGGDLGTEPSGRLAEAESKLAARLGLLPGLFVIHSQTMATRYPVADWSDAESDRFGHVPYTPEYFAALSATIARWYVSVTSRPRKVLVLDCDNTLWGGVVGEDGPLGVRVDGPFAAVQRFAAAQADSGRLVCLCSKNAEADVFDVFTKRPEMLLARGQITAHRIGWGAKSDGLRALAAELDLGLDSFVFLDDSPLECAEVRAHCPEVLTLQVPADPGRIPEFLEHIWPLDLGRVTEDDRRRAQMYADNAARARSQRKAPSLAGFHSSLGLEVSIRSVRSEDVRRAAQLTERTNQFNATGVRLSEADVASRRDDADRPLFVVSAKDRFGDYGTVGLAGGIHTGGALVADAFLLSCRALGRGLEHRMLAALGQAAAERGSAEVVVPFRASDRNPPARRFLERVFGTLAAPAGETRFRRSASEAARTVFDPEADGVADTEATPPLGEGAPAAESGSSEAFQHIALHLTTADAVMRALAARVRVRSGLPQPYVEPRRGLERTLADIWQEVLRVEPIGARDGFREIGGRSFELVQIHRRILDRLHVDLDITTLFQYPTVAELASFMAPQPLGQGRTSVADRAERMRAAVARQATRGRESSARVQRDRLQWTKP